MVIICVLFGSNVEVSCCSKYISTPRFLKGKIYQSSFSKVGTAHKLEMKKKNEITKNINILELRNKGEIKYGFVV